MTSAEKNDPGGWRLPSLFLLTFLSMAIWPALGLLISYSRFDHPSEWALLLGGITGILLFPFYMFFEFSDNAYAIVVAIVWILIWIVPLCIVAPRLRERSRQVTLMGTLSAISFGQAALGFLILLAKSM